MSEHGEDWSSILEEKVGKSMIQSEKRQRLRIHERKATWSIDLKDKDLSDSNFLNEEREWKKGEPFEKLWKKIILSWIQEC